MAWQQHQQKNILSERNGSVGVDVLCQSHERQTWWRITPRPASEPRFESHIALWTQLPCEFLLCPSPILNEHSGVVANCDYISEWVDSLRACIEIAMRWVTLRKSDLSYLLPARKMQFSLYHVCTSFQLTSCMWLLTIHRSFRLSHVLQLVAISGITCERQMMFPMQTTCKASAAGAFLSWQNCETGSKEPEF